MSNQNSIGAVGRRLAVGRERLARGRAGGSGIRRPRSVWFALATAIVAVVLVATLVLLPILGLIGASVGAAWFVHIPFVQIGVVVVAGYLLSAGLIVLIIRSRRGWLAWVLAVAATIAALVVSVYPAVAVAFSAVNGVEQIIPFIMSWIQNPSAALDALIPG